MVSRRKILSRSRDDLSTNQPYIPEEEEDVWYQKDKLFKVCVQAKRGEKSVAHRHKHTYQLM